MANKKAEVKSKKRTLYLKKDLYEKFAEILKKNGKSPSEVFNKYMDKIVKNYEEKGSTL
jgi:metal-responsive CopG/Arc/MetJ family transcriptional regulator